MREHRPKKTGLLTAGLAAVLAACQPTNPDDPPANAAVEEPPSAALPMPDPPLNRKGLLRSVAEATNAAVLGIDDAEVQRTLDGRLFEVRIRFGCFETPPQEPGSFSVRFDEKDRTLRLRAAPDLTLEDPLAAALAGDTVEAVEGFWIHRPWLLQDGCPLAPVQTDQPEIAPTTKGAPRPIESASPPGPSQRVGIAQFFTDTDTRAGRRDNRAFETTKVLGADESPAREGFNLVLSGRLRAAPSGPVINCRLTDAGAPPGCVISTELDRIRIERPDTKTVLAEWSN